MAELMLANGFGKEKGAPICNTADDAAGVEDKGTGCTGDPGKEERVSQGERYRMVMG